MTPRLYAFPQTVEHRLRARMHKGLFTLGNLFSLAGGDFHLAFRLVRKREQSGEIVATMIGETPVYREVRK